MSDATITLRKELAHACRSGRSEPPCTFRQFLERDVVIPDGKYKGLRFRADRQPVINLWIDAIDSGQFTEFYFTAPSQFGKTLIAFVGPLLWHTCERAENYVLGVPFADMAANKWELDVLPVMESSPNLRKLKPTSGAGSAGGKIKDMVTLRNGVAIKLMSAGSQDTGKAGFTSRVLGVTEAARFSTAGESSVEADPLRQLRARQRSYEEHERCTYVEGTVTLETDLPWRIKPISTDSRILTPCPHCEDWIAPERDNLMGWEDAKSENEAGDKATWVCPSCGLSIDEASRKQSLLQAKLIHSGQSVDRKGRVTGPEPDTCRLFFRAAAFHNLFLSAASIARDEWRAKQIPEDSIERHSADRELCQFVHCLPYVEPMYADDLVLDKKSIGARRLELPQHLLPSDTKWLTVGVDIGEKRCWWLALATRSVEQLSSTGSSTACKPPACYYHIPAYGEIEVPSDRMTLREAIANALAALHDLFQSGFAVDGSGVRRRPDQVWYDANHMPDAVLPFIRAINDESFQRQDKFQPWIGSYGRGSTTLAKTRFTAPRKTGNEIRDIDPMRLWYLSRIAQFKTFAAFWDSDVSKWQVQQAMTRVPFPTADSDQTPGSVTLFAGTPKIHERLTQHLTNERLETVKTIRGEKRGWVRHGANHLLDCFAMAWRAESRARHIASKTEYLPPTAEEQAGGERLEAGGEQTPQEKPTRQRWYEE
jgi:phage terminase large subunit GpA-like protein